MLHMIKNRSRMAIVLGLLLGVLVASPLAGAAAGMPSQPGQPPRADQRGGDGFVPVKDLPTQDKLPAAPLLVSAYAFVWLVLLVYVWSVWRRLTRVEREVRDLSTRLAARQGERR
jgi:CcmD family protein